MGDERIKRFVVRGLLAKRFAHAFWAVVFGWIFVAPQVSHAGLITTSDSLPPFGKYVGDAHALFELFVGGPIIGVIEPAHEPVHLVGVPDKCPGLPPGCDPTRPDLPGYVEIETFTSRATFEVTIGGLSVVTTIPGSFTAKTRITLDSNDGTTRTYTNELLELVIEGTAGGMPFILREDRDMDKESKGKTTIKTLEPGLFNIDSFFDVFTELSVDGGLTFIDCRRHPDDHTEHEACGRVTLVPGPVALALFCTGLGLLGLVRRRKAA